MEEDKKVEKVEEKKAEAQHSHTEKPKPVETTVKSQAQVEKTVEKKEVKEEVKKEAKKDEKNEGKKGDKKEEKGGKKEDKKDKNAKDEKPKVEIVLERKYTVPFYEAYAKPAKKRGPKAMKMLRQFVARHMKVPLENVRIDNRLSVFMNARGIKHPPKKLNVKLQKDKEGRVTALPA